LYFRSWEIKILTRVNAKRKNKNFKNLKDITNLEKAKTNQEKTSQEDGKKTPSA